MAGIRSIWVTAALITSLLVPVYFLAAAFGTKFGLLDWRVGFGLMTFRYGPMVLMGAAGFALVAVLLAIFVPPRRGVATALLALAIPAAGLGYGAYAAAGAAGIPPIHDVSTDLANPPEFSPDVAEVRAGIPMANSVVHADQRIPEGPRWGDLAGKTNGEVQAAAYPDLQPLAVADAPERAFDLALAAAEAQGWTVTYSDRTTGRIEATVQSFFFGFVDDIVVRVSPTPGGAVIDVRSSSRVGVSDLGANAKRIRAYLAALQAHGAS
jgi:uncharacterized protein (DUF1499 family)